MNINEAQARWRADAPLFAERGIIMDGAQSYIPDGVGNDIRIAMDAQPSLVTVGNAGIPAFLTTLVDPSVFEILLAPNKGAEILGEVRKGTWLDRTAMFPTVESTGEVSSYGDYSRNGRAGVNTAFPQRQSYLFQLIKEYGDQEIELAGLAKVNWVAQVDKAAAKILDKFSNLTYHYGVQGLQNYGILNDPSLPASLTPATKAATGTAWINSSGVITATANEIYADIQAMFVGLVTQSAGNVDADTKLTLVLSPKSAVALTATNSYNVNVGDLIKKNFGNIRIVKSIQYGAKSTSNPQGLAAGELVQLIADEVEGQEAGYMAFSEKMRAHPVIRDLSSFRQKVTGGVWGCVLRQPFAVASMLGI